MPAMPSTAWLQQKFRAAHQMLIGAVGDDVTLLLRNDTAVGPGYYIPHGPLKAKVSELRMQDIVAGSSARIGDVRVILEASAIPAGLRRLEEKDRVLWRGRQYGVVQYDDATDSIGAQVMAVNIIVRG